ncbi:MAG TPA: hypothetical protein VGA00_07675 [Acidiferrobacterales bacterium]
MSGLRAPLHRTHAGDGSARRYMVEPGGVIRVIDDGRLLAEPLDIRGSPDAGAIGYHARAGGLELRSRRPYLTGGPAGTVRASGGQ